MVIIKQVTLLLGAEEWSSHETQQMFREVAEYNQQMASRQASVHNHHKPIAYYQ